MTRLQPVKAYWRKLPDRPEAFFAVHAELRDARVSDLCLREVAQALEAMKNEPAERERV